MKFHAITERTDSEWPADHPLRKVSSIIAPDAIGRAEFLCCSDAGDERLPPAVGDYDVAVVCSRCPAPLVKRASAPAGLKPICSRCWSKIT